MMEFLGIKDKFQLNANIKSDKNNASAIEETKYSE